MDGVPRKRDQLGGPHPGAVEQFDERAQTKDGGAGLLAAHPVELGEQGADGLVAEYLGKRPDGRRARKSGGRIVAAKALVVEEAVESAKRGRLARHGRRLELDPGAGEPLESGRRGAGESSAEQLGRAAKIALVGEAGVERRARFRRQHLEEGGDQLPVLADPGHSRVIASAAIIRASYSSPTSFSAFTI